GPGRVRAQVVADVELSTTEEAREQYRPESQIVRSEQTAEESSRNGSGPQGVPGALTNQPPAPGVALPPGVAAGAQAANAMPSRSLPMRRPTTRRSSRRGITRSIARWRTRASLRVA